MTSDEVMLGRLSFCSASIFVSIMRRRVAVISHTFDKTTASATMGAKRTCHSLNVVS